MLLIAAKALNLSIDDLSNLTVGSLMDFLEAEVENIEKSKEPQVKKRKATQEDFDLF